MAERSFLNTAVPSAVLADPIQLAAQALARVPAIGLADPVQLAAEALAPVPAIVTPLIVPLFAVTSMSLTESYHLPPIGSSQQRMIVAAHDDRSRSERAADRAGTLQLEVHARDDGRPVQAGNDHRARHPRQGNRTGAGDGDDDPHRPPDPVADVRRLGARREVLDVTM